MGTGCSKFLSCAKEETESEIEEFYSDPKLVFASLFDAPIEEAVVQRRCTYIELTDQMLC
jgi:hypothetical protein